MKTTGQILRAKRKELGLLLKQVSASVDIDQAILSKIERNERKPTREILIKLAQVLNLDEDELLVQFISDKIAYEIASEDCAGKMIKLAEKKIKYLNSYSKIKLKTMNEKVENFNTAEERQLRMYLPPIQKSNIKLKQKDKIDIISLFSGCGGMDLGFHKAGFDIKWANDIDQKACETYAKNIGDHIVCDDITKFDYSTIPDADLILGGFPCQDFSMIWKRGGISTERGNLYRNFVEIVSQKQPLMFVAENVKGLITANKKKAIKQIIKDFSETGDHGYNTTAHLINFAEYGVAQLRQRVLIIGVRKDLDTFFDIPAPLRDVDNYLTSKEALKGVNEVKYNNERQKIQANTIEKLKLIPPGGNFTDIPKSSPHYVKGMISHVYRRLHPDKPSSTIIAAGGGGTWGYHYDEPRPLTNRERARLFGYPDDFIFEGTITEVRKQIGNSVPPSGILPFAKQIKTFLENIKADVYE